MDDVVKVEVQIIELDIILGGLCDVDRNSYAIYLRRTFFDDSGNYFGVLLTEPAERGGNTTVRLFTMATTP
jgi:hypothetical protein